MTGSIDPLSDAELADFFAQQDREAAEQVEYETMRAVIGSTIIQQLDLAGASRIYDPDPQEISERAKKLAIYMAEQEEPGDELDIDAAEQVFLARLATETATFFRIGMVMMVNGVGELSPDKLTEHKKQLHADLLANNFDEGWIKALDKLIEGPLLDISQEADLAIYTKAGQAVIDPEPSPITQQIESILPEVDDSELAEEALLEINRLHAAILIAGHSASSKPDAEAHIHSMKAAGIIDDEQLAALLDLLTSL